MYIRTRSLAGDTHMRCRDCGHEITMNKICERPIQAATDMLKHMAAHNASRAFAAVNSVVHQNRRPHPRLSQSSGSLRCRGWLRSPNHPTRPPNPRALPARSPFDTLSRTSRDGGVGVHVC